MGTKNRVLKIIFFSFIGVVLIMDGIVFGYYLKQKIQTTAPVTETNTSEPEEQNPSTEEITVSTSTLAQEFMTAFSGIEDSQKSSSTFVYTRLPLEIAEKIVWMDPVRLPPLGLFGKEREEDDVKDGWTQFNYYMKGNFIFNEKLGYVIFSDTTCPMGCDNYGEVIMFVLYDGKITAITKLSEDFLEDPYLPKNKIFVDRYFDIAGLHFPEKIAGPEPRQKLVFLGISSVGTSIKEYIGKDNETKKEFTVAGFGNVLRPSKTPAFGGDFLILGPDLRYRRYYFTPDFIAETGIPIITWNDGTKNDKSFSSRTGVCGGGRSLVLVNDISVENDLIKAGTNSKGDVIYFLKDDQHKLLKDIYENIYENVQSGENGTKISYTDFIKQKPAFFWVDPFGRIVFFTSDRFSPPAECGKPVIYLYPEKTTKVSVKIDLSKLSYSEPAYNGGWEVVAEPNGQLTEVKSGLKYPYLFWEGLGVGQYDTPEKGFVVARENVDSFLSEKLGALGLNSKEISDFKEYWIPKMTKSPYYFVTFLGTGGMNQLAPLHLNPQPDTMIRVLMDYKPLAKPIQAVEPILRAPERRGFTVVEWGGVLGRE